MSAPDRIIYVLGDTYCGSTLLTLQLGRHPQVEGLGEVDKMLLEAARQRRGAARIRAIPCSCGESLADCPFWAKLVSHLEADAGADYAQRYRAVLDQVREFHGPGTVIVDSSKSLTTLPRLLAATCAGGALAGTQVLVLHLFRDPRGSAARRRAELGLLGTVRHFRLWQGLNAQVLAGLQDLNCQVLPVSYEQFCWNPDAELGRIYRALGLDVPHSLPAQPLSSHVGRGNGVRQDSARATVVRYDARWFEDPLSQLLYFLVPGVRALNRRLLAALTHDG